ncbi:hypothetical protein V6N13_108360 [Hibiscus sabdariffa]
MSQQKSMAPFRYLAAWQGDLSFVYMLQKVCVKDASVVSNLDSFIREASVWNRDVFGHMGKRKARLLARIRGIEKALKFSSSTNLQELEQVLKEELDLVLAQEESLWFQRSRSQWIANGIQNTHFYHCASKARHHQKTVSYLKLANGVWSYDSIMIRNDIVGFFWNIFPVVSFVTPDGQWNIEVLRQVLPTKYIYPILAVYSPSPNLGLDRLIWKEEVKREFTVKSTYGMLRGEVEGESRLFVTGRSWGRSGSGDFYSGYKGYAIGRVLAMSAS